MSTTTSGITYDLRLNVPALDGDLSQAEARVTASVTRMNALRVVIPVSLDLSAFNAQAAQVNSTIGGWQNGITIGGAGGGIGGGGGGGSFSATQNNLTAIQNNVTAVQQIQQNFTQINQVAQQAAQAGAQARTASAASPTTCGPSTAPFTPSRPWHRPRSWASTLWASSPITTTLRRTPRPSSRPARISAASPSSARSRSTLGHPSATSRQRREQLDARPRV
jgi:hypothetical protein